MTDSALTVQIILNGLMSGSIYILIALGLTLVLSIMGIVQLAHGEIYMLGAYVTYFFCVGLGLNYMLALVISAILVGILGIFIERFFYRPFRDKDFLPTVIMALAIMVALQTTAVVSFGSTTKVVHTPFTGVIKIAGATLSWERVVIIIVSLILVVGLFLLLQKTKVGQAMRAVSQNKEAAALQGISTNRISSIAMFIGCALAAVAGGLMGAIFTLNPFMGGYALMKGIAVIILGGLGSLAGAVVGGLVLGFVDSIATPLLGVQTANMIGFIFIIMVLLFRPQGILGHPSP